MLGSPQVVVPHPPGVFDLEPEIIVPSNGVDQLLMKAMLLGMKDGKDGTQPRCNVVNDANFPQNFPNCETKNGGLVEMIFLFQLGDIG